MYSPQELKKKKGARGKKKRQEMKATKRKVAR